jgi:DNA repair protein RadC
MSAEIPGSAAPMPSSVQEIPAAMRPGSPPVARAPARIHDLPEDERPREKLLRQGAGALSDAELLAIFFRTGVPGMNAVEMGRSLLARCGHEWHRVSRLTVSELTDTRGIGEAKAIHLVATFELGKRLSRQTASSRKFDCPEAVLELLAAEMRAEPQEVLSVLLLDTRLKLLGTEEITRGSINETIAHPRDVLHHVVRRRAHAFIIVHNHPAGDPSPSSADRTFTRRVRESAEILQVSFMDHIIIGIPSAAQAGYFSFRENGCL